MVILVTFLSVPQWDAESNESLDLCEFFAGKARVSKLASWVGYRVRSYDINFEPPILTLGNSNVANFLVHLWT